MIIIGGWVGVGLFLKARYSPRFDGDQNQEKTIKESIKRQNTYIG